MKNNYQLNQAKILKVVAENPTTNTFYLKLKGQFNFDFDPGQFMMIGLPGFGECPISISSDPKQSHKYFSLTVRTVGQLTQKINELTKGSTLFVRGPFGNGFPEVENDLVLIGGGCGFIPLKSVYEANKKKLNMKVFIGCKNKDTLVFQKDYPEIKYNHNLNIILEKEYYNNKQIGFVTELLKQTSFRPTDTVFVCGPELMYKSVVKLLLSKGIQPQNIYLSLEKRMHCGLGVCQHCAIGSKYVCKDGPVFGYDFLKTVKKYNFG